ncbi:hypothetical protein F5Y17DRAFT_438785 [Xylariaceae sp. FL0594]|nr:hypothetical protein F5Y17DRAFT_438785 [Xylariaceae sp. FL0594]
MATDKKIILITGGNTGLGLAIVKALAESPNAYDIIVGSRSVSKGEQAVEEVKKEFPQTVSTFSTIQIDYESDESLEKAAAELSNKYDHLDVLINNGGVNFDWEVMEGKKSVREAFNRAYDTNVSGTHILTHLLAGLLVKSSQGRLLFIASGTGSLSQTTDEPNFSAALVNKSPPAGWPKPVALAATTYRCSKTAMNMLMREWRRILLNDGVKVFSIGPGLLATNLGGIGPEGLKRIGAVDPSVGGNFIRDVVEGKRDHDEGKVVLKDSILPW